MGPTEVGSSAVVAVLVSETLNILKRSDKFKWLSEAPESETINRVVGGIAAFLTGIGLQFQFDSNAGDLVIHGLVWSSLIHGFTQWAAQQAYYRIAFKKGN